ncbi:MAG: hypothetical protein DRJ01_16840 [Bacteroidetes bacterium]|nr:MAG: hypothetical protein DRJ01_16840 [Bacteroidota bacterium]
MLKKIIILSVLAILIGCAGKEPTEVDTIPPLKPHMIHHLGDTGYNEADTTYYDENGIENNGIDAIAGNQNCIQIQWEHLLDTDLDYICIYRFNSEPQDNDTIKIATMPPIGPDRYKDKFPYYEGAAVGKNWYYFIKPVDTSGNFTFSDTVCYRLIDKPILNSPGDNSTVQSLNDVTFNWNLSTSSPTIEYCLLLFNEEYKLLWRYRPLDTPGTNVSVEYNGNGPNPDSLYIPNSKLIWRVDAFGSPRYEEINGVSYTIPSGSESVEKTININR